MALWSSPQNAGRPDTRRQKSGVIWPKGRPFLVATVLGGLGTALQGLWEMVRWRQRPPQSPGA